MEKAKLVAIRKSAKGSWQGLISKGAKLEQVSLGTEYTVGSEVVVNRTKIDGRMVNIGYVVVE